MNNGHKVEIMLQFMKVMVDWPNAADLQNCVGVNMPTI